MRREEALGRKKRQLRYQSDLALQIAEKREREMQSQQMTEKERHWHSDFIERRRIEAELEESWMQGFSGGGSVKNHRLVERKHNIGSQYSQN